MKKNFFGKGIYSFLFNPSYITRKLLYNAIYKNKNYIRGIVLDFGCGEKPYKDLFIKCDKYIGVDYESSGHDNKMNDVDIYRNGKDLPVKNEYFDSFICTEVLEHVFDIDITLSEIKRTLKRGGKGIITLPFMAGEHETPYDFARYSYFGIEHIIRKHGFKIITHERLGNSYLTLLQLTRNYISQIIHSINNYYLIFIVNIFFGLPIQIIINLLSLLSFSKIQDTYLNNFLLVEKI